MAHRTITPPHAAAVLLRVLTGLVLLIALVGGVPLALLSFGHQPTQLSGGLNLLLEQDDGTLWLTALTCIGWAAWAAFTISVVVEVVAVARRRSAPRIRGLGSMQSLAGFLVGGIVLLAPTAASAATTTAAAALTQTTGNPGTTTGATPSGTTAPDTGLPTHTVTTATETPWALAEKYLDAGQRWRDIAALNPDISELTAGDQYLPVKAVITLPRDARTTAAATGGPAKASRADASDPAEDVRTQTAEEGGGRVVTVHSGDYLSKIAEEELGDGNQWPHLFEASRGKPQPHGLPAITNPDVIYAGQQVTVPADQPGQPTQDPSRKEKPGNRETSPPDPQSPDAIQSPGDDTGDATAPAPGQTSPPKPSASSAPSAPTTPSPAPEAPKTIPVGSPLNLHIVLGAGALLAAAVTGALALRRTLQRRRRKPGEKIAIAAQTSPAEAQLATAAEPAGAARLDAALRTLAHHLAQQDDAVLPPLRAARIGIRTVQVLPDDLAQEPLGPFTSGQGGWWDLPAKADLLDEAAAREVPAPYPGLTTIGSTTPGDLLLLNLTELPALLLDGDPLHINEVCTSLALEVGMSPWASDVEIVTVGFGEELPRLLPTARIAHMRRPSHALRDLGARLLEAHQIPETRRHPYLLLCASALDEDTSWQFADAIARAGTVPVTLIAPASTAAADFPEAAILNASLSEPQHLDPVGTDITVQRLEHAAYQQIATALKVSGQPPHTPEGPWRSVPDELNSTGRPQQATPPQEPAAVPAASIPSPSPEPARGASDTVFPALLAAATDPSRLRFLSPTTSSPRPGDGTGADTAAASSGPRSPTVGDSGDAAAADNNKAAVAEPAVPEGKEHEAQALHAPQIRVLGPIEVTGVDSTGHGPKMAQLAALLYFRPGRSAQVLCADMDPASPWSTSTLNARMQGLRSSLGSDPAGHPYVPRRKSGDDPYRLAPGVQCDWTRFLQLAEHALPLGPSGLGSLEKALTLVRGKPFGGRPLPWAEPLQQEMLTRIIDVAHTVATYRIPAGPDHDLSAALRAVATGLDADDTAELLYRDWMRIEAARASRSGLHTVITRVQQINQALDCSLEIETTQLIDELLNHPGPAGHKDL
ncbi:hypothetical protein [Streptomyces antibioticus]|uniref:hypothetical protein n=1 Tax=Streptomyces antibioticus TaxID=1890 RepID=UPI0036DE58AD